MNLYLVYQENQEEFNSMVENIQPQIELFIFENN